MPSQEWSYVLDIKLHGRGRLVYFSARARALVVAQWMRARLVYHAGREEMYAGRGILADLSRRSSLSSLRFFQFHLRAVLWEFQVTT